MQAWEAICASRETEELDMAAIQVQLSEEDLSGLRGERRDGPGATASTTAADQRQQGHDYGVEKEAARPSAGEVDDIFDPPLSSTPNQQSGERRRRDGAGETASTTAAGQRQEGQDGESNLAGDCSYHSIG